MPPLQPPACVSVLLWPVPVILWRQCALLGFFGASFSLPAPSFSPPAHLRRSSWALLTVPQRQSMGSVRRTCTLEQALHCAKCGAMAPYVEECTDPAYSTGETVLIECPTRNCREKPWFYCKSCKRRCHRSSMQRHAKSPGHLRNATFPCPQLSSPVAPNGPFVCPTEEVSTRTSESPMETLPDFTGDVNEQDMDSVGLDPEDFHQQMENDLATTQAITLTPNSETRLATSPQAGSPFPKNRSSRNEWLADALCEKKRATTQEINLAFSHPELLGMRNFWMAEHASGEGRCGGGICYLAARAFQQAKDSQLDTEPDRFPDYGEALWHFTCLLQFQSQNEKQRMRQSRLHRSLADHLPSESLFKQTFIP